MGRLHVHKEESPLPMGVRVSTKIWTAIALIVCLTVCLVGVLGASDAAPSAVASPRAAASEPSVLPGPRRFQFARPSDWQHRVIGDLTAVAHAPDGALVVADRATDSLMRLDRAGRVLDRRWGDGTLEAGFGWKIDAAVGQDGRMLFLGRDGRVHAIDALGHPQPSFEVASGATGLGVLPGGDILVTHKSGVVYRYAPDGRYRGPWVSGMGWLAAVDVHPEHGVWIADLQARRVLHFDLAGRMMGGVPEAGESWAVGHRPTDLAIAPSGEVAVAFAEQDYLLVSVRGRADFITHTVNEPLRVSYAPNGTLVAVPHAEDGRLVFVEAGGVREVVTGGSGYLGPARDLALSDEGLVVALVREGTTVFSPLGERLATWLATDLPLARGHRRVFKDFGYLAVAPDGTRWISGWNTLVRVSARGRVLSVTSWQELLGGEDEGAEISLAVAVDGSVYAVDPGRAVLAELGDDGSVVASWPVPALRAAPDPAMAGLPDGTLAVVHAGYAGVLRFHPDDGSLDPWSLPPESEPVDIAVDPQGGVVIADGKGRRLIRLDELGRVRSVVMTSGVPQAIAIEASGVIFAVIDGRIHRGRSDGSLEFDWSSKGRAEALLGGIDVAADGTVLLAVEEGRHLGRFDSEGNFQGGWPVTPAQGPLLAIENERGPGAVAPAARLAGGPTRGGIAVDPDGHVCVVHIGIGAVLCFTPEGRVVERIDTTQPGEGLAFDFFSWGGDVAIALDGTLWIAEPRADRVTGLRANGEVVRIGGSGAGPGQLDWPLAVAAAEDGTIFVTDAGNRRVQRFSSDGGFLAEIGPAAGTAGAMIRPLGLAVHGDAIDVADPGAHVMRRYSMDGRWLGDWGQESSWMHDVAWSEDGRAYVATALGVDVYDQEPADYWIASVSAGPWQFAANPVWRTVTKEIRLPGLGSPHGDRVGDPRWHFTGPLSMVGDRARLWQLDARGRVELRIDGLPIFFRDPVDAGTSTYAGFLPRRDNSGAFDPDARVEVDYAPGEQAAQLDLKWLPWDAVDRVHLPVVGR